MIARMRVSKTVQRTALALAISTALVMAPIPARANDVADAGPFIIFATAFTVVIIIIAVNNPTTPTTNTQGSGSAPAPTASASSMLRAAPPVRGFGFTGHF
jgi:hypothetical protein